MIATTKIRNPAIIDDAYYECHILGDGIVQHFGQPTSVHNIRCTRLKEVQEE